MSFWLIAEWVSWSSGGSPSLCRLSVTTLRGYKLRKITSSFYTGLDFVVSTPILYLRFMGEDYPVSYLRVHPKRMYSYGLKWRRWPCPK